jgi:hypothetical protein
MMRFRRDGQNSRERKVFVSDRKYGAAAGKA